MTRHSAWDDQPVPQASGRFGLRILATTDLHMHLVGHNYYTDQPDATTGLVHTATLIRQARSEAEAMGHAVLLVDNGDFLQGTPMGEIAIDHETSPHPIMAAFGALGYDAIGLGNHDFDFGPDALIRVLRDAPCPVLCSNLVGEAPGIEAATRRRFALPGGADDLTVGLLSVLPPQTLQWNAHHMLGRYEIEDMVEAARRTAAALKRDGCDLVVALAHTGLAAGCSDSRDENAAIPIAALTDIDAVVAGHTHQQLPGPAHLGIEAVDARRGRIHGTAVVMPGHAGTHLGLIDLILARNDDGWHIETADVSLRPAAGKPATSGDEATADPVLETLLAPLHCDTRTALQTPVGRTDRRLHSYFTLCGPDHGLALIASAQAHAVAPFVEAAGLGDVPLLSVAAPCKFGARAGPGAYTDVPAGPVLMRHISDLTVFIDEIRVLRLTFGAVLEWLEMSAGQLGRIPATDGGHVLIPEDVVGYNFDVMHGLRYQIDPTLPARYGPDGGLLDPAASRVRDVTFRGSAMRTEDPCLVVTNSYRSGGGGRFAMAETAPLVPIPPVEVHHALRAYIAAPPEAPGYAPPWRLTAPKGTSAGILTGPPAGTLLDEIDWMRPEDLGLDARGFRRLRLRF